MADSGSSSSSLGLGLVGLIAGCVIAFLFRPSVPLAGQLPFETVISRGANLQGFGRLLVPTAETSFNMLVAGGIIGAIAGLILGHVTSQKRGAP